MAHSVEVGTRVSHPKYGDGVVGRLLDGGRKCLVRFDRSPAVPYVLPVEAVGFEAPPVMVSESSTPDMATSVVAPTAPVAGADRQVLEALRLGVVPTRGLTSLTVGRHEERARVDEMLDVGAGMIVISGGYGYGKTHMVELAEAEALERGFLVARATFDPVEVPPSHPLRLYGALVRGMVYPDGSGRGLRPLLDALGDRASHLEGDRAHRWLSAALFAVHHAPADLADAVLEFVGGQAPGNAQELSRGLRRAGFKGTRMLGLPDYRTFGQIMAHMLGGVSAWARDAGHQGLVVLLDEAEYLDRLGAASRRMAENVLRYLAVGALPEESLGFSPESVYRGGQAVHRRIPPRFQADQSLVVICAFTPNPEVDLVLNELFTDERVRLDLDPVRPSLLPVLAEKVYGLVKGVHSGLDPDPAHRSAVTRALAHAFGSGEVATTRQAARMVVEFWDLYRRDPERALRALA